MHQHDIRCIASASETTRLSYLWDDMVEVMRVSQTKPILFPCIIIKLILPMFIKPNKFRLSVYLHVEVPLNFTTGNVPGRVIYIEHFPPSREDLVLSSFRYIMLQLVNAVISRRKSSTFHDKKLSLHISYIR